MKSFVTQLLLTAALMTTTGAITLLNAPPGPGDEQMANDQGKAEDGNLCSVGTRCIKITKDTKEIDAKNLDKIHLNGSWSWGGFTKVTNLRSNTTLDFDDGKVSTNVPEWKKQHLKNSSNPVPLKVVNAKDAYYLGMVNLDGKTTGYLCGEQPQFDYMFENLCIDLLISVEQSK